MIVEKNKKDFGLNEIRLIDNNKTLFINYMGNGDLYWSLHSEKSNTFEITKKDYKIYEQFEKLYNRIINCKVYEPIELELAFCDSDEQIERLKKSYDRMNNSISLRNTHSNLVENDVISYYSDDNNIDEANIINISNKDDKFILEFDFRDKNARNSIRICNSGSRYQPFNIIFMEMYNELLKIDIKNKEQSKVKTYKI